MSHRRSSACSTCCGKSSDISTDRGPVGVGRPGQSGDAGGPDRPVLGDAGGSAGPTATPADRPERDEPVRSGDSGRPEGNDPNPIPRSDADRSPFEPDPRPTGAEPIRGAGISRTVVGICYVPVFAVFGVRVESLWMERAHSRLQGARAGRPDRATAWSTPGVRPAAACPAYPGRAARPGRGHPANARTSSEPGCGPLPCRFLPFWPRRPDRVATNRAPVRAIPPVLAPRARPRRRRGRRRPARRRGRR